jgi:DNA-binding transcriptional LysR family regulator
MSYLPALRSFVEVYWCGSVTQAASRLGLTQPGVSGHLRVIETLVGRPLFVRSGRGLTATAVAQDLAKAVGDHFTTIETALSTLRARSTQLKGTVHLAGPAEYLTERAATALARLTEYGLKVRVHFGNRDRLYQLLDRGTIDLAVTASKPSGRGLEYRRIDSEILVLLADPITGQRLRGTRLTFATLRAERWISYDEDLPLVREYFEHVYGQRPAVQSTVCAEDLRAVRALTRQGPGLTVLPDYLCEADIEAGRLVELGDRKKAPVNALYLVWNRSNLKHPRVAFARDQLLEQLTAA